MALRVCRVGLRALARGRQRPPSAGVLAPRNFHGSPAQARSRSSSGLIPQPLGGKRPQRRASVLTALAEAELAHQEQVQQRDKCHSNEAGTTALAAADSPYLQPSEFEGAFRRHVAHKNAKAPSSSPSFAAAAAAGSVVNSNSSSLAERTAQQTALRAAFDYADRHHRIRMAKDKNVLREEVRAFRAAHGGRRPTAREVSRHTDVSLAPVAALQAVAHLDPKRAPMHRDVQEALLLQQSITRSELLKSNERTLVRCLGCFHVYAARPRELWGGADDSAHGGSGQQSWIALEREKRRVAEAERLMRRPSRRRTAGSVGRRQQRAKDSPVCCPMCSSTRAQWALEYVHHRTHAK